MAKMKQFTKYRDEIADYMSDVVIALKARGNYDPKVWYMPLQIFAQNLQTWFECREIVEHEGIMIDGQRGGVAVHPALCLMNSIQIRLEKMITEYGLTPKSLKGLVTEEDDTDNFIENLMN